MKLFYIGLSLVLFLGTSCSKCYTCQKQIFIENADGELIPTDAYTEQNTCDKEGMEALNGDGYSCVLTQ